MIPLYTAFTPSHRVLKEKFFEPSLPPDVEPRLHYFETEGDGFIHSPSWCRGVIHKVEVIIQAIRENWGRVFVWSDVDAQFFGPISEWAEAATRELDIVFQVDAPGPALCNGFFFCRGNEETLRLWTDTLAALRAPVYRGDDQRYTRDTLWNGRPLRWGHLPPQFIGGGTFTGRIWEDGGELPVPDGVLVHHANFTCGVPNKIRQCEVVLEKIQRRDLIPMEDAYARVGGREKFPFEVGKTSASPKLPSIHTASVDYATALAEMRAEPGFHPMGSEPDTGEFIAALIRMVRPRAVLELGTHRGHTTLHLIQAMASQPDTVTTVDCHDSRSPVLRRFDDRYTFILGDDRAVLPALTRKFDFIYLDTLHTFEHTRDELAVIQAHQPDALLALHDPISHPGVARAIAEQAAHYDAVTLPTPVIETAWRMNGLAVMCPKHRRFLEEAKGRG
jgi:predicted O-methyltransferase YrrM